MANQKDERAAAGTTGPDWGRLADAVEMLARHVSVTATVEPRALDGSAKTAANDYAAISEGLRTIFEPGAPRVLYKAMAVPADRSE